MTAETHEALPQSVAAEIERTEATQKLTHGALGLAVRSQPDGTVFFLIAGEPHTGAEIEELSKAFVGPSFARRRPPAKHLQAGEPFSEHIERLGSNGRVVALLAPSGYQKRCAAAIARLLEVRARRPLTATLTPRRLAEVLRDFEDAVAREDVAAAEQLVAEAESTGRLSLTNKSRMDVRVLACARAWDEVIDYAVRYRLPDLHLPASVQHDVVRAGFTAVLAGPLKDSINAAVDAYGSELAPRIGGVFRDHLTATSPEARLAWMIRFATLGTRVPQSAIQELLDRSGADERPKLREIATHTDAAERTSEQDVREMLGEREDASAWAVAQQAPDLPDAFRQDALLRAAKRLEDPVRVAQAELHAFDTARDPVATVALQRTADVDGWPAWLQALYDDPEWPEANKVVDAHANAWNEQFTIGGGLVDGLAALIEALAGEAKFVRAMPRLARAVMPDGPDRDTQARERSPILQALAYAIAAKPGPGSADLDTLADLASAILAAGVDEQAYGTITDQLRDIYVGLSAPPLLARWVLDTIAMLLSHPAPSDEARDGAARRLLGPLLPDAQRSRPLVQPEVWEELQELLEGREDLIDVIETVQRAAAEGGDDEDIVAALHGKTVLLLTLVEGAATRASEHLLSTIPGVKVVTDSSSVATDHLKEHARRADLVVVASRACKHAAYDCVQAAAGDRIVYASGKGWSSLVGAVYSNIRQLN